MAAIEVKLSVKLSLSESTYYFTNPVPPTLTLTLESHAERPITLFTWNTPFDPKGGMVKRSFSITDIGNDKPVTQRAIRLQRSGFSRTRGSNDERLFLTLLPHVPTVVPTGFSQGSKCRPEPRAVVERGWMRDAEGNELNIRRSTDGCGVDGLEGGHRYRVDVARGPLMGITWWWGTKEDAMVEPGDLNQSLLPGE